MSTSVTAEQTRRPSQSLSIMFLRAADTSFRLILVIFSLYVLVVCPNDVHLTTYTCRTLSLYRQNWLSPSLGYIIRSVHETYLVTRKLIPGMTMPEFWTESIDSATNITVCMTDLERIMCSNSSLQISVLINIPKLIGRGVGAFVRTYLAWLSGGQE